MFCVCKGRASFFSTSIHERGSLEYEKEQRAFVTQTPRKTIKIEKYY